MSCQWRSQRATALPAISVKFKNTFSVLWNVNVLLLTIEYCNGNTYIIITKKNFNQKLQN